VGSGVRQALTAGADGVVYDSELESALGPATHSVLVGQVSLPRRLRRCAVRPAFSTREKQILTLVVHGCANREIANRLFLAESTIKTHLASAFDKLGVRSRKEAAALLVDPDEGLGVTLAGVKLD
jgi:DNA-binding NarL/FixJ family response regulator